MSDRDRPSRPALRVISNDHPVVAGRALTRLPTTLRARSPARDRDYCRVRVSREDVSKAVLAGRRQPAMEFWSLLARGLPPVPMRTGEPQQPLYGLSDAHACFRGLLRPLGTQPAAATTVAYVLKPTHFYEYDARPPVFSGHQVAVPPDLVFMAYVALDVPPGTRATIGTLTHWSFVTADPADPALPSGWAERYVERCW